MSPFPLLLKALAPLNENVISLLVKYVKEHKYSYAKSIVQKLMLGKDEQMKVEGYLEGMVDAIILFTKNLIENERNLLDDEEAFEEVLDDFVQNTLMPHFIEKICENENLCSYEEFFNVFNEVSFPGKGDKGQIINELIMAIKYELKGGR